MTKQTVKKAQRNWEILANPEKADPPWNEVLEWWNDRAWEPALVMAAKIVTGREIEGVTDLTEAEFLFVSARIGIWTSAIHWVYRETWDSKHKIPRDKNSKEIAKLYGNYFIAVKELCKECFFHLAKDETLYPSAAMWFCAILNEDAYFKFADALYDANQDGRPPGTKPKACEEYRRTTIAPLKGPEQRLKTIKYDEQVGLLPQPVERKNPISPSKRHLYSLIESAIELANKSDQFEQNYYKPFVNTLEKWVKHIETSPEFTMSWVEGGKVFSQNGRGKHTPQVQLDPEIRKSLRSVT